MSFLDQFCIFGSTLAIFDPKILILKRWYKAAQDWIVLSFWCFGSNLGSLNPKINLILKLTQMCCMNIIGVKSFLGLMIPNSLCRVRGWIPKTGHETIKCRKIAYLIPIRDRNNQNMVYLSLYQARNSLDTDRCIDLKNRIR